MPAPTGLIGFSPTTPAAPSGRLNVGWQTDSASPLEHFSANFANHGQVETRSATSEAVSQADQGQLLQFTNASPVMVSLLTPTDATFMFYALVSGTGGATFVGTTGKTINGGSSLVIGSGGDAVFFWDGNNWEALLFSGSGILLQTNGTNNGSQSKLNLVAGGNVILTDDGSGDVTIAASISGTSGTPIVVPATVASTSTNWQNETILARFYGYQLLQYLSAFTVKMLFMAGSPAIGNMVVYKTALGGSTTVLSTTQVKIGGLSNPTLTSPTFVTTDSISLVLDSSHDWVFAIFFTNVAGNASVGVNDLALNGPGTSGWANGDQTGVSTIPSLTTTNKNYLVLSLNVP